MPRGIYIRHPKLPDAGKSQARHISKVRTEAVMSRWESVRAERATWIKPFAELPIERAMAYLEDLRKICEDAGHMLNERINRTGSPVKCAGPRCGKDLSGTNPNGRPKWMAKKDYRDAKHTEIMHSLYFCSDTCANGFNRAHQGAQGGDGR